MLPWKRGALVLSRPVADSSYRDGSLGLPWRLRVVAMAVCAQTQHDAWRTVGAPQMRGLFLPCPHFPLGWLQGTAISCFDFGFTPESPGCPTQAQGF